MNKRKTRMIAGSLAFCFVVCALSVGILAFMAHGATPSVYADPDVNDYRINEPQVHADPDALDYKTNTPAVWADPGALAFRLITTD
ncbi:MAG: hypothetical protein KAQ65_02065 [Candidatus Thorarchaeota archaeon]|nr:hypothetical protein [Candidatus Thorarchaeota archaeon]MCK5238698.1 hypothetical protein [Candidatus Thorarchaeota archaeon]